MSGQTFEVLILGTASASPTLERNVTAQLLNICERHFLIDCGEGTQIQLRRFRARFQAISDIFISHLHGDHVFGLPGLLGSMHLLGRKTALTIHAPVALKELMDVLQKATDTHLNYELKWNFTRDDGTHLIYEDPKVEVYSFPLSHRMPCTGFVFREKPLARKINRDKLKEYHISNADIPRLRAGLDVVNENGESIANSSVTIEPSPPRSYAYCSDTAYFPSIIPAIEGADLLYHESTFLNQHADRAKKTFHSTAEQAAKIARDANVKRLLLGHYSARYSQLEGFLNEAGAIFPNCELAIDGKLIKI